jgi:FkbM family methyltransferase
VNETNRDLTERVDLLLEDRGRLRNEVKELRARLAAYESSRWWRLHPRLVFNRLRTRRPASPVATGSPADRTKARWTEQLRLRVEHERLNTGHSADEIVLRDGLSLKVHPESRRAFEEFCYIDPDEVRELDEFIAQSEGQRRLLDVGAFHGVFSLTFATQDSSRSVLAVEPSPMAFAKLLYNIHRNRAANVHPVEAALSSGTGTIEMNYVWDFAVVDAAAGDLPPLSVRAFSGDALCASHSFSPDVIKIDAEGHEAEVLRGLRDTIGRGKPLIFLEIHPHWYPRPNQTARIGSLIAELSALGYPSAEVNGSAVAVESLTAPDQAQRVLLRPTAAMRGR